MGWPYEVARIDGSSWITQFTERDALFTKYGFGLKKVIE